MNRKKPARRRPLTWVMALIVLLIAVIAVVEVVRAGSKAGEIVIERKTFATASGESVAYELGTLYVPENRANPRSRLIGVGFARLRSPTARGASPAFVLPGGPGDSYLDSFDGTDSRAVRQRTQLLHYLTVGDVVVVDQRGFSKRGDVLRVHLSRPARALDRPVTLDGETAFETATAKAAVAAHADKDLAGYNVREMVEDVNDLRRALGYERIKLVGQSFGSQWSLAVMRLKPQIVERALLSGVEPLDNGYDMPSHVYAALARIAWDADRDEGLKPYLPRGGVMAAVHAVRDRFARAPVTVTLSDEKTPERRSVVLGLGDFQRALIRPAEQWPAWVLALYHGHYDDWAREVMAERGPIEADEAMIGPMVDTSLGVSGAREHLLRSDAALGVLGAWNFDSYIAQAPVWPSPDIGDDLRTPVLNSIPVLFVHGDWDTSTPVENPLGLLPYFRESRALIVHRGGHGARTAVLEQRPDVLAAVLAFLGTGDTQRIPAAVSLPAPAFTRPTFAPPAQRPDASSEQSS